MINIPDQTQNRIASDGKWIMLYLVRPVTITESLSAETIDKMISDGIITSYYTVWIICASCQKDYKYRLIENIPTENIICECGNVWIVYYDSAGES